MDIAADSLTARATPVVDGTSGSCATTTTGTPTKVIDVHGAASMPIAGSSDRDTRRDTPNRTGGTAVMVGIGIETIQGIQSHRSVHSRIPDPEGTAHSPPRSDTEMALRLAATTRTIEGPTI